MSRPSRKFDLCAGRPYTTSAGEDKKFWINVGTLVEWDDGGFSVELHATPAGNWFDGKLAAFEKDENRQRGQRQDTGNGTPRQTSPRPTQRPQRATDAPPVDDFSDEIPFISMRDRF